ncbi:hypothetical protein DAL45_13100 [Salmonella enterica subsp. enterica serovar Enteritidis]|nr:hypothetical protein [Salmonella enterica]ECA1939771.1 hypothetical protein [Salmonella enterica subsp. enterica serovar Enteritidis]ECC9068306.1 hypothetical protein [Salmonella enterica subsp. diarizonae]ECY5113720.1 hypothetical protein [Salmonella enterica subsp. enterica serovar Typhimurium]HCM1848062.1 hypothetical protein [Salmonella enterica subsp. diarizonae serovar 16:z10:e,n,x,z15]
MFLIVILAASVLLMGPVMYLLSCLAPRKGFIVSQVTHRKKHWLTLHLAPFDRVGHLDRRQAYCFHQRFLERLAEALHTDTLPVFFKSHLMRPVHMRTMHNLLHTRFRNARCFCIRVPLPPAVRAGIRFQVLVQEWRWITVPETGILVVIYPESRKRVKVTHEIELI